MIHSKLFRKHFAIAALSVLGFAFAGSLFTQFVMRKMFAQGERSNEIAGPKDRRNSVDFFARLIDSISPGNPAAGLKKLESLFGENGAPLFMAVLDEKGETLYQLQGGSAPKNLAPQFPRETYETVEFNSSGGRGERFTARHAKGITKFNSTPPAFLYFEMKPPPEMRGKGRSDYPPPLIPPPIPTHLGEPRPGPPRGASRGGPLGFAFVFSVSVAMILGGVIFALYVIFYSLREQVRTADHVISELQKGNLKARFSVRKKDEIGQAMIRFNQMADEIEKLVERVRAAEQSRTFMLQELAHDLRTPVASLRSLQETIFGETQLNDSMTELSELATKETDYISRLVEDLLLLAQVSEPRYRPQQNPVDLVSLLKEEGESLALRRGGEIQFSLQTSANEALIPGDERLMQRLARNTLDNAFSYARKTVKVQIEELPKKEWKINVVDDGPGFEEEALLRFGERRNQRTVEKAQGGRLSLGLGSVIMKAVVTLHRGAIRANNEPRGGANIEIILPGRVAAKA